MLKNKSIAKAQLEWAHRLGMNVADVGDAILNEFLDALGRLRQSVSLASSQLEETHHIVFQLGPICIVRAK